MKSNRVRRAAEDISNLGSLNFFSKSFKTEANIAGPRVWTSTRASLESLEGSVSCFLETWKSLSLSISSKTQSNIHLDNLCVLFAQSLTASKGGEGVVDGGGGRSQPLLPLGPDGGTAKVDHQRAHLTWEWNGVKMFLGKVLHCTMVPLSTRMLLWSKFSMYFGQLLQEHIIQN